MAFSKILIVLTWLVLIGNIAMSENNPIGSDYDGLPFLARRYFTFEFDIIEKIRLLLERKDIRDYISITDKQLSAIKNMENEKWIDECQKDLIKLKDAYQKKLKSVNVSETSKKEAWEDFDSKTRALFQKYFFEWLKKRLTTAQYERLFSVILQVYGPEMLMFLQKDMPNIEKMSFTEEQKRNIGNTIETFHAKKVPLMKFIGRHTISEWKRGNRIDVDIEKNELDDNITHLIILSKNCDKALWQCFTEEQKHIFDHLIGQKIQIKWEPAVLYKNSIRGSDGKVTEDIGR